MGVGHLLISCVVVCVDEILERVQGRQERRAAEQAEKTTTDTTKIEEETPTHCSQLPDHRELQDPEYKEEASSQGKIVVALLCELCIAYEVLFWMHISCSLLRIATMFLLIW